MQKIHDAQNIKILNKDSVHLSLTLVLASVIEKCFEGYRLRSSSVYVLVMELRISLF